MEDRPIYDCEVESNRPQTLAGFPPLPPIAVKLHKPTEAMAYAQEYASLAVAQERERCAKLVETQKFWEVVPELASDLEGADEMRDLLNFQVYGPVAAAIRKRPE